MVDAKLVPEPTAEERRTLRGLRGVRRRG